MEDLIILVQLIQGSKFRSSPLLNILLEPGTQMRDMYDALAAQRIQDDKDALQEVPALNDSISILATVKSKLKERLHDALLFIEINSVDSNDRQKAYLDTTKKWGAINVLLSKNYRELAIVRLEQLLRYTRRFEFTDMTVEVLQSLRLHMGLIYGSEQQYREYRALLEQFVDIRSKEERAETCYADLMIDFVNSKSEKHEMAELAEKYYQELEPYAQKYDSYRLQLFTRLLQISIYDNRNDYQQVILLCEDAIAFFDLKPYKSFNALQVFYYSLLTSYLNLRQYERCRVVANQYRDLFQSGSYNWFKWQELYFLTEFHAGQYDTATEIWLQVTARPEYLSLPAYCAEVWKIFEAYIFFLVRVGCVADKKDALKIRPAKLWNEIHVANRDKSGMNIPILVIQFLIFLAENDYGQCIDRQEGMAKYRTRYLKPADAARSHYFFKMLNLIPKNGFQAAAIEAEAVTLMEKLQGILPAAANQNIEVEIIPYETLWAITMTLLKTRSVQINLLKGKVTA